MRATAPLTVCWWLFASLCAAEPTVANENTGPVIVPPPPTATLRLLVEDPHQSFFVVATTRAGVVPCRWEITITTPCIFHDLPPGPVQLSFRGTGKFSTELVLDAVRTEAVVSYTLLGRRPGPPAWAGWTLAGLTLFDAGLYAVLLASDPEVNTTNVDPVPFGMFVGTGIIAGALMALHGGQLRRAERRRGEGHIEVISPAPATLPMQPASAPATRPAQPTSAPAKPPIQWQIGSPATQPVPLW